MGLWLEIALGVFLGGVLLANWRLVLGILWMLCLTALGLLLMGASLAYIHGGF